jgi:hypothetical protein
LFNQACNRLPGHHEFLLVSRLFRATRISKAKNTEAEVMTARGGYRLATSIDGTLTGRGGDLIIIDDPLKPVDALSESKRERVNQWYFNTLLSRLDDKPTRGRYCRYAAPAHE